MKEDELFLKNFLHRVIYDIDNELLNLNRKIDLSDIKNTEIYNFYEELNSLFHNIECCFYPSGPVERFEHPEITTRSINIIRNIEGILSYFLETKINLKCKEIDEIYKIEEKEIKEN